VQHSFENVAAAFLATNGAFKKNARGWKPRTYDEYERTINDRLVLRWKAASSTASPATRFPTIWPKLPMLRRLPPTAFWPS